VIVVCDIFFPFNLIKCMFQYNALLNCFTMIDLYLYGFVSWEIMFMWFEIYWLCNQGSLNGLVSYIGVYNYKVDKHFVLNDCVIWIASYPLLPVSIIALK